MTHLSYADILFSDRDLAPELRWRIFLAGLFASLARQPETNYALREMLGGRKPTDADITEIMRPAFDFVMPRVRHATRRRRFEASAAARTKSPMTTRVLGRS